ncbi:hypothetical protein DIPPA_23024 [Diplonema papillatum]|nr:hypothetical protein DIPPA_23024 [Diplonema papillatum]
MASASESREALEKDAKKIKAERDKLTSLSQGTPTTPFVHCKPVVLTAIALWTLSFCLSPSLPCPLPGKSAQYGRVPAHGVLAAEVLFGAHDGSQLAAVLATGGGANASDDARWQRLSRRKHELTAGGARQPAVAAGDAAARKSCDSSDPASSACAELEADSKDGLARQTTGDAAAGKSDQLGRTSSTVACDSSDPASSACAELEADSKEPAATGDAAAGKPAQWVQTGDTGACDTSDPASSACAELEAVSKELAAFDPCSPADSGWWAARSELAALAFLLGWAGYALAVAWVSLIASTFLSRFSPFLLLGIGLCGAGLAATAYQALQVTAALHNAGNVPFSGRTLHLCYWIRHFAAALSLLVVAQLPSFSSPVAGRKPALGVGLEAHAVLLSLPLAAEVLCAAFFPPSAAVWPSLVLHALHFACLLSLLPFCLNFIHLHHRPMTRNEATETFLAGSSADHLS